ncbi:MAG TPA: ankyrin repeat domain-containing protein [Armatimonadota bacterium]
MRRLLLCLCLFLSAVAAFAVVTGPSLLTINGVPMAPLQPVADWLGATVDKSDQMILIRLDTISVRLSLTSKLATINGKTLTVDTLPVETQGALYLPLTFMTKAFQVQSAWDTTHTQISLSRPGQPTPMILLADLSTTEIQATFFQAINQGKLEAVKTQLTQYPRLLDATDSRKYTALMTAAQRWRWDIMQYLITQGANIRVTLPSNGGITLLHQAARGNIGLVALLVEKGLAVNSATTTGYTPLHAACEANNLAVAEWLLAHDAKVNVSYQPPRYGRMGDEQQRTTYLLGFESTGTRGTTMLPDTPLGIAVVRGYVPLAKLLLAHGADVKGTLSDERLTLLHLAAFNGQKELVPLLVESGLDVNSASLTGFTPLHCAVATKQTEIMSWLLEHGAKVDAVIKLPAVADGPLKVAATIPGFGTPLSIAVAHADAATELLLLQRGATPMAADARQAAIDAFRLLHAPGEQTVTRPK